MGKCVEQQYSAEQAAVLLGVNVSTVWRYHADYTRSDGKAGLGPLHKLSHRVSRFPASAVNGFLESKRTTVGGARRKRTMKTRREIVEMARRQLAEVNQLFLDTQYWNEQVRKADEAWVEPDPDGQMERIQQALCGMLLNEASRPGAKDLEHDEWIEALKDVARIKYVFTDKAVDTTEWEQFWIDSRDDQRTPMEAIDEDMSNA